MSQRYQALRLYEDFNKYEPKRIAYSNVRIPTKVELLGEALNVDYRSGKRDPETLRLPKKPINYTHEHEGGVKAYECGHGGDVTVPDWIRDTEGLVRLGLCLGFGYEDGEGPCEVEGRAPLPTLYSIPSGRALLIVQGTKVLAMIWGGQLDVLPEGIVG
jgi:hypothetical protein